jgi:hypothetical protein
MDANKERQGTGLVGEFSGGTMTGARDSLMRRKYLLDIGSCDPQASPILDRKIHQHP